MMVTNEHRQDVIREPASTDGNDDGVSSFVQARSVMLARACRTLGSAAEAEDVVQDVWLRWQDVDREVVRNSSAFLTTTTTRLAINRAMTARTRHEAPMPSLAEPVHPDADPATLAERSQALEGALRLLFEKLSPGERAAYLLREAFDYSYGQIALIVQTSEVNSRQLVTRARVRLADGRRSTADETELRRFVLAFVDATQRGDLARLEAVLSADIAASLACKASSHSATRKRNATLPPRLRP